INTQVIARDTGKRLGVVKDLLVDIDRREVVALALRDNILAVSGIPKYMYLESICQTGDVVLVENEDVIEDIEAEMYSNLINSEVITEVGTPLGKVRDFVFDPETGTVSSIIIASLGFPQIPDRMISTYEISMDEVVSSGPNRLIVFEGCEDRITQLTVGLLERFGIGKPAWEREEEEMYYPPTAKPENQLPTGTPLRTPLEARKPVEERWDEDSWENAAPPPPRRLAEPMPYEEEYEEDNWGNSRTEEPPTAKYEPIYEAEPPNQEYDYEYEEEPEDMWDDEAGADVYNPPPVNIPQTQKEKQYEE
ncbi:MAG: PRC-barrel domain containing protein, partial [Cyanobacteria bacterium J083]